LKPRRRKTPETAISAKIRTYAATYAASGQKERAEGMLQAADLIDDMVKRGALLPQVGADPMTSQDIEVRFAAIEKNLYAVMKIVGKPEGLVTIEYKDTNGLLGKVSSPSRTRRSMLMRTVKPSSVLEQGSSGSTEEVLLSTGEGRILAAIAQRGRTGASLDELIAMVDYRETSLRTYLGNLRAAGYIETVAGRHLALEAGEVRVSSYPKLPIGAELGRWWLARLSAGERVLLERVVAARGSVAIVDLVGESTHLRETSVRTYIGLLMRRKLLVRPSKGNVALAPILKSGEPQ
jgi:hypothetical protein